MNSKPEFRVKLSEGYQARVFRFLRLIGPADWRIKLYGIRYKGTTVNDALVEAGIPVLLARLAESSPEHRHYGVGFAAV